MQVIISFVFALFVFTLANIGVSAAPVPQNIGDALEIQYNADSNHYANVNWSSVFGAVQPSTTAAAVSSAVQTTAAPAVTTSAAPVASVAPEPTSAAPATPSYSTSAAAASPSTGTDSSKPLWGLTYSPYNNDGSCPDQSAVTAQLQKLVSVTDNIRLYSTDCSQLEFVLKAISENNLNLDVYAGIWVSDGASRVQSDLESFVSAVKAHPGLVKGVSVGNEDLFKGMAESTLIGYINQVRSRLQSEGLSSIPVSTTDTDAKITSSVIAAVDLVQVNIYAVFDATFTSISNSVQSVITRANNIRGMAGSKPVRLGETGWASAGTATACPLTLANQKEYAQAFRCAAKNSNLDYFFFEAKNADWKPGATLLEKSFGLFDSSFNAKFDLNSLGSC
ncbi:hypothetical protein FBU59_002125 [Linderina macrospora]|uniref:Uncharacterized protein n=1 Tax=Linderina macrospora TaxID=4868 RepID=A0ACC1JC48_9FUNG|nr:hypothetical protein FBU59_002125 [Linderina macrospora]